MAGEINLHSQMTRSPGAANITDSKRTEVVLGPALTDEDSHSVLVRAVIGYATVGTPGTATFQFWQCDAVEDAADVVLGGTVGPEFVFAFGMDSIVDTASLMVVDPDPPAGGWYALTIEGSDEDLGSSFLVGAYISVF